MKTCTSLTDKYIRNLQPDPQKQIQVQDSKEIGFGIRVNPKGSKTFFLSYRLNGKQRRYKIGRYPDISLADARKEARKLKGLIAQGNDPAAKQEVNNPLFQDFLEDFINRYAKKKTQNWKETDRILRKEFLPSLKNKRMREIKKTDLIECINRIVDRGSMTMANQAHRAISKVFNWSVEQGILDFSPYEGAKQPGKNITRDRVLTDDELQKIWRASDQVCQQYGTIIKLLILTGQRRNEVCNMRYSDLDFDQKLWSIPGTLTKSGKPQQVPLSKSVIQIIKKIPKLHPEFIFPARGKKRSTTCSSKWKRTLDEISGVKEWKQHDLRRTVATGMQRLGVKREVTKSLLNHTENTVSDVTSIYTKYDYLKEKREALKSWDDRLRYLL